MTSAPLHVVQVVPSYAPGWRYGGPIRSVRGLSAALVRAGARVTVLTTQRDEDVVLDVPTDRAVELDGASVHYLATRGAPRLRYAPSFPERFASAAADADVVHVHGLFNAFSTAAMRAARRAGLPAVLSPRGMLMRGPLAERGALRKRAWLACVERENLARLAAVHATSDLERDELPQLGFDWPRVHVAPNGVEPVVWDGDRARLSARVRDVLARGPLALFVGRLNWKKGLDRLLEACVHLDPRVHVVVAGPDDGWRGELFSMRERLGLGRRVTVLEAVQGDDLAALQGSARVAVLPSRSENFGNAIGEALAFGCPVVVTPAVGAAELVERHGAGSVVCGVPRELATAIERLALDDLRHHVASQGARRAFEAELGWDGVARGFLALYGGAAGALRRAG
jgi:glycosyltransferase involved in cell wall biosynthesis